MIKEFKPALFFLAKFVGVYLVGNILYGAYITAHGNKPDEITEVVAVQSSFVLNMLGQDTYVTASSSAPNIKLMTSDGKGLLVFEGCNGINVMIVFIAFMVAFGGRWVSMTWFVPVSLVVIHIANISRLVLLYFVNLYYQPQFYFFHKYFFTAILYVIVFLLWMVWIKKWSRLLDDVQS